MGYNVSAQEIHFQPSQVHECMHAHSRDVCYRFLFAPHADMLTPERSAQCTTAC